MKFFERMNAIEMMERMTKDGGEVLRNDTN